MDDVRFFIVNLVAAMLGFFVPIQDFLTAAICLFCMNFLCGLVADMVAGSDWNWKKAFTFFIHCFIFFGLAAFIFICGHFMHNDAGAVQCVSIECYAALYLYGCNILRNLRSLCDESSIMYKLLDFFYFLLTFKFVTKVPYWKEYAERTSRGNGTSNRGEASGGSTINGGGRR